MSGNPLKSVGWESRRQLEKAVREEKAASERRLMHLVVKELSSGKDAQALLLLIARKAGEVDGMDRLLSVIYDADKS